MPFVDQQTPDPKTALLAAAMQPKPQPVDAAGMGSSAPSPQGKPVPNWLQNVLSAMDQSMTTGFPGMRGAGPPTDPRAELMIPLMMLGMAAEPGPDVLGPIAKGVGKVGGAAEDVLGSLLKRTPEPLKAVVTAALRRGTPKTVGDLAAPLPIKGGQYTIEGTSIGTDYDPYPRRLYDNQSEQTLPAAFAELDNRHTKEFYGDPFNGFPMGSFTPDAARVLGGELPRIDFAVRDADGGIVAAVSVRSELASIGSQSTRLEIDLAGQHSDQSLALNYDPGGPTSNKLGMEGLRDIAGHVLSIYRKNFDFKPDFVGGIRVKNNHQLNIPADQVQQAFEAAWKGLFGAAAAMPVIEVISNDDKPKPTFAEFINPSSTPR